MVQFGGCGPYSLISTTVNPSKKKKDSVANLLVNSISESIKTEILANPVKDLIPSVKRL